ncbi:MAG: hypothetical protein QME94_02295 [Anaerolineae bacterium]|nr:hypothetical protein [Anaerolineae bacterium]
MIPIELVWFIIVLIFGLIGVVRGYLRELGVTTVVVLMLFAFITFEKRVAPIAARLAAVLAPCQDDKIQAAVWVLGIAVVAFVSYHGQTLAFEGTLPKTPWVVPLNLGAGLVNGYLIAGSIWHYLNRLGYPFLGIQPQDLSPMAQGLVPLMPPCLLAPYLLYLGVFLLLMRVIR